MKLVNVPRCCSLVTREFRPRAAIKVNKCDLERRERTTWESGMHSSVSWHNTRHRFVREISWNRYVRYRWWPLKDRPQIITPTPPTKCINLLNHGNVLTLNQGGIWACHVGGNTFTPEFQMSRNLRKILCQPRDNFRFDRFPCANHLAQLLQKFYSPEIKNVYWLSRISKSKEIGLFLCWRKEEEEIKEKKKERSWSFCHTSSRWKTHRNRIVENVVNPDHSHWFSRTFTYAQTFFLSRFDPYVRYA